MFNNMIASEHALAEAYDSLNLPRGASLTELNDRFHSLRARLSAVPERLSKVQTAYELILSSECARKAAVDASGNRTRSERVLDEELERVSKKARIEAHVSLPSSSPPPCVPAHSTKPIDRSVFAKLRIALLQEDKFIRTGKLIASLLQQDPVILAPNMDELSSTILCVLHAPHWPFQFGQRFCMHSQEARDLARLVVDRFVKLQGDEDELSRHLSFMIHVTFNLLSDDAFTFNTAIKKVVELIEVVGEEGEEKYEMSQIPTDSQCLVIALQAFVHSEVQSVPARVARAQSVVSEAYRSTSRHRDVISAVQKALSSKIK